MDQQEPRVDPYLFQRQFQAFRAFVEAESGSPLVSFGSHPYVEQKEGYKYRIHRNGRDALAFPSWGDTDIGTGRILSSVIQAIELPNNNLVQWLPRFGEDARAHQPLIEIQDNSDQERAMERTLFALFRGNQDEACFSALVDALGKRYPLIAYLFFLKDQANYLPIAPTFFDRAFEHLGATFKTSHRCSWPNYQMFLGIMTEVKNMLREELGPDISLLDAHSFVWVLTSQMWKEGKLAQVDEYLSLTETEREAIVKARVGQGRFRTALIGYWDTCAVTGCTAPDLLIASHIKPWSEGTLAERLDQYNGLLLSPALDKCFDTGLISFNDIGRIVISDRMSKEDASAIGIHAGMRLRRLDPAHQKYLAYHREHVFR